MGQQSWKPKINVNSGTEEEVVPELLNSMREGEEKEGEVTGP